MNTFFILFYFLLSFIYTFMPVFICLFFYFSFMFHCLCFGSKDHSLYPNFCEDAIRLLRSHRMCRTYSEGANYEFERYNRYQVSLVYDIRHKCIMYQSVKSCHYYFEWDMKFKECDFHKVKRKYYFIKCIWNT